MNDTGAVGAIFSIGLLVGAIIIITIVSIFPKDRFLKADLIRNGMAQYIVNKETGETKFVLIKNGQEIPLSEGK